MKTTNSLISFVLTAGKVNTDKPTKKTLRAFVVVGVPGFCLPGGLRCLEVACLAASNPTGVVSGKKKIHLFLSLNSYVGRTSFASKRSTIGIKKDPLGLLIPMVGVPGFEPGTLRV